ncbi:hypothetical protein PsorP6_011067 [Peronosclerospora sorghi]|uniref:Uncharacterized protein n=1 Tax=Peronosclerospora sorghi TaxID=230839 RepID=A0ACC0VTM0_9STRA|nr:hypothetical protein PsorP6_011067 [Peronosclerospora sorghi]
MDPATYDEDVYRAKLLQQMRRSETIVYQAIFVPENFTDGGETMLVAATSLGLIHVYLLGRVLTPEYWEQVSQGFGGDQDFRVWKWRDILSAVRDPAKAKTLTPTHVDQLPRRPIGSRGALPPLMEINDMAVNKETGHLFLAGGDSVVHEWDLTTQQFTRQFEGHTDYVHAVRFLQHSQELVTGSEDGTLGIWDVRTDKNVAFLRPHGATTHATSTSSSVPSWWIGAVAHDRSETWLACGGGTKRSYETPATGGFFSMWHLPSRVPVHVTTTMCDVRDVAFHDMDLLSVGNEARLKKWNRSLGHLVAAATSTVPSCYFCAVDPRTDLIAVGGVAPAIDIYTMPGVVSFTLLAEDAEAL